jgi:hypothetical protein
MQEIPIEEYFKYHPPQTEERKAAHERIGSITLSLCQRLIELDTSTGNSDAQIQLIENLRLFELCGEPECRIWIVSAIADLKRFLVDRQMGDSQCLTNAQARSEILKHIQQIRMFANQGVTLDELRLQRSGVSV